MTSKYYRNQIAEAVDAIRINSSTSYAWFGQRSQPLSSSKRAKLNEDARAECLTVALQHQLYSDFYTLGRAMPVTDSSRGIGPGAVAEFTTELAAANCGTGYWDDGWQVKVFEVGESASVSKKGLTLQAEFRSLEPKPEEVGQAVAVYLPNEAAMSPGYYVATGIKALSEERGGLFRLYWNLFACDAVWLMSRLTAALIGARVSFRFKTLRDPNAYRRADAAVLYFNRHDAETIRHVVGELYPKLPKGPKVQVPALTLGLVPGLGFAEDPGGAQSFGLHRCRLVAEALVWAHRRGAKTHERLEIVENRFVQEGIPLDRPYLNPQSAEPDIFPVFVGQREPRQPARVQRISREECLTKAAAIGSTLCRDAFWHRDACTWAGIVPDPNHESDTLAATECRTLGPDLYAGTAGIGLFLAQLHAMLPSKEFRRTALGAMRHALLRANATEPSLRFGLYTGSCGIALAGLRVAHLLGDGEIRSSAHKLVCRILKDLPHRRPFEPDLLSGKAGIITSLLLLAKKFGQSDALNAAVRLGDLLLRDAREQKGAASWPSARIRRRRDLTGYSHGAAGVALALLELSAIVREERFAAAAERGFEYERQHFVPEAANWRDFRPPDSIRRHIFASAWCNGAPGIGLSRLRAWQISRNEIVHAEAEVALLTARQSLKDALSVSDSASCLCHGLTGNADILLEAERRLGGTFAPRDLIGQAAARAEAPPATPSLMLGQAGVGYFLLRVADPAAVPTALLIGPGWLET